MAGTGTLAVIPDTGTGAQVVNTLPPSGQATPAQSLPMVLDTTVEAGLGTVTTAAVTVQGGPNGIPVPTSRPPLTYSKVTGSPFTLTSTWTKVTTTTAATRGLRLSSVVTQSAYDIEWVSVAAGSTAPTDTFGEPILAGEDFAAGLPIGDIYLKSASGQTAIVKTGA